MSRLALMTCFTTLATLAVSTVGCGGKELPAEKKAAAVAAHAVPKVAAAKPLRKTLSLTTTQPGRIEAFETAPLHAKVAGYVEAVLVDIGDTVKKDQVLVRLSIPELQDDVMQKEALVTSAEARVKQAESATAAAKAAAETAAAKIAETEAGVVRGRPSAIAGIQSMSESRNWPPRDRSLRNSKKRPRVNSREPRPRFVKLKRS